MKARDLETTAFAQEALLEAESLVRACASLAALVLVQLKGPTAAFGVATFERIPSLAPRRQPSPMLGKGPGFDLKAPGAAILAGEMQG